MWLTVSEIAASLAVALVRSRCCRAAPDLHRVRSRKLLQLALCSHIQELCKKHIGSYVVVVYAKLCQALRLTADTVLVDNLMSGMLLVCLVRTSAKTYAACSVQSVCNAICHSNI